MMRESGAKSRTALRIFLFFWTWLWETQTAWHKQTSWITCEPQEGKLVLQTARDKQCVWVLSYLCYQWRFTQCVYLYLYRGFERGWVRVVCQTLAVALFFNTQQDLNILSVLITAGLLVTLHPRFDLVLPQRRVLCWLLFGSCTLRKNSTNVTHSSDLTGAFWILEMVDMRVFCKFTFTLEDFLEPSRKACKVIK